MNRIREKYIQQVIPEMKKRFSYRNDLAVPKIEKIVLNMGVGEATGPDRVKKVIENTLNNALLDVDYSNAKGAIIHITGGPELTMKEAYDIYEGIRSKLNDDVIIKPGAIATDLIPKAPSSFDHTFDIASSPALAAEYALCPAFPLALIELIFTIIPFVLFITICSTT